MSEKLPFAELELKLAKLLRAKFYDVRGAHEWERASYHGQITWLNHARDILNSLGLGPSIDVAGVAAVIETISKHATTLSAENKKLREQLGEPRVTVITEQDRPAMNVSSSTGANDAG